MTRVARIILLGLAWLLSSCDLQVAGLTAQDLPVITRPGELVVVTRNAPTTYYLQRDEYTGPEYDLVRAYARKRGFEVRFIVRESLEEIFAVLREGQAHLAAAGLTETETRDQSFRKGPVYQYVKQQLVCRRGGKQARHESELSQVTLVVQAASSYDERLRELQKLYPDLTWQTVEGEDTEALLERVWRRQVDCTIADSNIIAINRRYHPELMVMFDITRPQGLVWYMPADGVTLQRDVQIWLRQFRHSGRLATWLERYYGYVALFDYVDNRKFLRRVRSRLPNYRPLFEKHARQHNIPWTLLAAQAYQESHWNPHARSPTGVRGIMMLTKTTAQELGVSDRLDVEQSIEAGARYLAGLKRNLPTEIQEPDRTWYALAAYNVGMGHLRDAMFLAEQLGKNPYRWSDLKSVLPLLSQKSYYRRLTYGYARGQEPVDYVDRIRNYEDLLRRQLRSRGT